MQSGNFFLKSTGLYWDPPGILQRYGPLRKIAPTLSFHLVYHPYLVVRVRGEAKGRWLPGRRLASVWAVDITNGMAMRLLDSLEAVTDTMVSVPGQGVRVQSAGSGKELVLPGVEVFPARIDPQRAVELAEDRALTAWQQQFRRPFGSTVAVRIIDSEPLPVYKPFWIIIKNVPEDESGGKGSDARSGAAAGTGESAGSGAGSGPGARDLLVVDASTGLVGMAEFRPVLAAWAAATGARRSGQQWNG